MASPNRDRGGDKVGLAGVAVILLAVVCCAGGPLLVGAVGSAAVGTVLGLGAGLTAAAVVVIAIVLRVRARRQCETERPPEVRS